MRTNITVTFYYHHEVMAYADLRAELKCSICLDIYTDPLTLKCGHRLCRVFIERVLYVQKETGCYFCRQCMKRFKGRPELQRNVRLCNIMKCFMSAQPYQKECGVFCTYCVDSPVPESRKCSIHKKILEYYCTEDDICVCASCCMIGEHTGHKMESLYEASEKKKETSRNVLQKLLTKREETEERVQSLKKHRRKVEDKAADDTHRVTSMFTDLKRRLWDLKKRSLREISGQAERTSMSMLEMIRDLEIKKDKLSMNMHHIEELCNMTDPLTVLQESDIGDLCDTEDGDDEDRERHDRILHDGGDRDVAGLSHTSHTLYDITSGINVCFYTQEAADILLDVNTAHNYLHISDDGKTVSRSDRNQNRTETPERFRFFPQVLSSRSFSSGRHYWEVDVGGSDGWRVGMCYPSIGRRGWQSEIGCDNKSWGLVRIGNQYAMIHDSKRILLHINPSSNRVRIFVDYEGGQISFYDVCDQIRHLHTFTTTFIEPLHAGLHVGRGSIEICGGNQEF